MFRLLFLILLLCISCTSNSNNHKSKNNFEKIVSTIKFSKYDADKNIVILVDYSIPSNKDRMFVYDINKKKVIYSCWCAHGFGRGSTPTKPIFSNELGSNCSSLGLFSIDRWEGTSKNYGYKYHCVEGLSTSNSNARKRQILIHYWHSMDIDRNSNITEPLKCDYRSAGCFTLTTFDYEKIDSIITSKSRKILLYSYYKDDSNNR